MPFLVIIATILRAKCDLVHKVPTKSGSPKNRSIRSGYRGRRGCRSLSDRALRALPKRLQRMIRPDPLLEVYAAEKTAANLVVVRPCCTDRSHRPATRLRILPKVSSCAPRVGAGRRSRSMSKPSASVPAIPTSAFGISGPGRCIYCNRASTRRPHGSKKPIAPVRD